MIYFDNAATSYPKPRAVTEEQTRCMLEYCGNAGRGSHALALAAAEKIYECRSLAADFFGAAGEEKVVFTQNTTMALNIAIKGLLKKGDHVLISDMEHNAVWRPIEALAKTGFITYDVFPTFAADFERGEERVCRAICDRLRPNTAMLVCAHASNICSSVLPLRAIGQICRQRGILFVVDGAQSAGHIPIHMKDMQISALCLPGHKGLWGPQGSGMLILGDGVIPKPLLEGGSGYQSLESEMPRDLPEHLEAGTLPTPAIAGLCAGIREVSRIGGDRIGERERELNRALYESIRTLSNVTVYTPHLLGSVLLFNVEGLPANQTGEMLDRMGFCVRAGYHCAALAHRTLRTPVGGAVRVSPGYYNTFSEIEELARAIREIAKQQ